MTNLDQLTANELLNYIKKNFQEHIHAIVKFLDVYDQMKDADKHKSLLIKKKLDELYHLCEIE